VYSPNTANTCSAFKEEFLFLNSLKLNIFSKSDLLVLSNLRIGLIGLIPFRVLSEKHEELRKIRNKSTKFQMSDFEGAA
jgi:hypothetical protein